MIRTSDQDDVRGQSAGVEEALTLSDDARAVYEVLRTHTYSVIILKHLPGMRGHGLQSRNQIPAQTVDVYAGISDPAQH